MAACAANEISLHQAGGMWLQTLVKACTRMYHYSRTAWTPHL